MDGVPLTLGWDHRTDPSLTPLTGSERVVIVRGPGSLPNGPNTLGRIDRNQPRSTLDSRLPVGCGPARVSINSGVIREFREMPHGF
jgi:hypothetical protein